MYSNCVCDLLLIVCDHLILTIVFSFHTGRCGPGDAYHRVAGGAQHPRGPVHTPAQRGRPGPVHQRPRRLTTHARTGEAGL